MKHRRLAHTVSITPFDAAGRVDEQAFRKHLRRQAEAGMGVYIGGGGSGEGYTLSLAENRRLLEIGVEELKGRVPVRAMGVEPRTAAEMVAYLKMAAEVGVDAAQVYSLDVGHGHRPTTNELVAYFSEVVESASIPLLLSTHQAVGYVMPVDAILALFDKYPHLAGLNFSHHNVEALRTAVDALADRYEICVGGPEYSLTCLSLGGHGYLCSEGNLAPRLCRGLIDAFEAGDLAGVTDAYGKVMRLSMTLYGLGGIRVTKAVLDRLGLPGGRLRKPRQTPDEAIIDQAFAAVMDLSLPELEQFHPAAAAAGARISVAS